MSLNIQEYVARDLSFYLKNLFQMYSVITLTGPRQSGKTTLAQKTFPTLQYYSLEDPDTRALFESDPKAALGNGSVILDEIQKMPILLSYIQGIVDREAKPGLFLLTGSNQFELKEGVTQSLAGRTALLELLPLSFHELQQFNQTKSVANNIDNLILNGFYPGMFRTQIPAKHFFSDYIETYVQRDLQLLMNVHKQPQFQKFLRLCAGRTGSLFNASNLATQVGTSVPTIQSWVSILERSYIIFFLQPWHANIGKRLIKSPKLYFHDTGLACWLLGIYDENQLSRDPLRGELFENLIVSEFRKSIINKAEPFNLFFFRDSSGNEVDILQESRDGLHAYEIKSSTTYHSDFRKGLLFLKKNLGDKVLSSTILYAGEKELQGDFNIRNFWNFFRPED